MITRRLAATPLFSSHSPSFFRLSRTITLTAAAAASSEAGAAAASAAIMPTFFISHGGGPAFVLDTPIHPSMSKESPTAEFLRSLPSLLPRAPAGILCVSAHWEAPTVALQTAARPGMYYDYYGFPEEAYKLKYPAPGDPALAARVKSLLTGGGLKVAEDAERGYDHGTFIPLMVAFPEAKIPVVQLSLQKSLDPAFHYNLGRLLAPLRKEGILILGSGFATHNLRAMNWGAGNKPEGWAKKFVDWLDAAATAPPEERKEKLLHVSKAPHFRDAHPREDHLIPIMVAAGAADGLTDGDIAEARVDATSGATALSNGKKVHDAWALGAASFASYRFG